MPSSHQQEAARHSARGIKFILWLVLVLQPSKPQRSTRCGLGDSGRAIGQASNIKCPSSADKPPSLAAATLPPSNSRVGTGKVPCTSMQTRRYLASRHCQGSLATLLTLNPPARGPGAIYETRPIDSRQFAVVHPIFVLVAKEFVSDLEESRVCASSSPFFFFFPLLFLMLVPFATTRRPKLHVRKIASVAVHC